MLFFIGFQELFGIVEVLSGSQVLTPVGNPFHLMRNMWPLPCFLWEIMASTFYLCSPSIRSGGGVA